MFRVCAIPGPNRDVSTIKHTNRVFLNISPIVVEISSVGRSANLCLLTLFRGRYRNWHLRVSLPALNVITRPGEKELAALGSRVSFGVRNLPKPECLQVIHKCFVHGCPIWSSRNALRRCCDGSRWEPFSATARLSLRADSAALVNASSREEKYVVSRSWQLNPDGARLYQKYYGSVDVGPERRARLASDRFALPKRYTRMNQMAQLNVQRFPGATAHRARLVRHSRNNRTRWAS